MSKDAGNDYLKNLFAQKADHFFCVEVETQNPALTATNIPDLLARINLGFLNPYLQQDCSRIFSRPGSGTHFFYNHECPTMQSKAAELSDAEDDDDDFVDLLDIEEGSINLAETLSLDLTTPYVKTGLDIRFNEDTGFYQLDAVYIKPDDEDVTVISCAMDNRETLDRLTTELSPLVMKVVNGQDLDLTDMGGLWPFQVQSAKSGLGKQTPNGP